MKTLVAAPSYRRRRTVKVAPVGGNYPRAHVDGGCVRSFLEQHRAAVADGDVELATSLACKAADVSLRVGVVVA